MKYNIFRKAGQRISTWPGGTTTELFIYPEDAAYPKRNFMFRLSSATVEAERSVFTSLPGFKRILMILDGEIEISHEGKYKKILRKSEKDFFNGSWNTTSKGKAVDFNLMMANGLQGSVEMIFLAEGQRKQIKTEQNTDFTGMYIFLGKIVLNIENETVILESGDFLMIEKSNNKSLEITAETSTEIILSSIRITDNDGHPCP